MKIKRGERLRISKRRKDPGEETRKHQTNLRYDINMI